MTDPDTMRSCLFLRAELLNPPQPARVSLRLRSLLLYCLHRYCAPRTGPGALRPGPGTLSLYLVLSEETSLVPQSGALDVALDDDQIKVIQMEELPWQARACEFPVVQYGDTIITGVCAVARHIAGLRTSSVHPQEHAEGLLGFRKSCLQAPNEASIWTKFCEIDLVDTVEDILKGNRNKQLPVNIARFENHLRKPVKVHNVYKLARETKTQSKWNDHKNPTNFTEKDISSTEKQNDRVCKNRKWKSASNNTDIIDSSTPIDELNVDHKFAEGPFLTLADLVLYPCYSIIADYYGKDVLNSQIPCTMKWLESLEQIEGIRAMKATLENILSLNSINPASCNTLILPPVLDVSLYKCDPKRHNPKKRLFTKEDDIEEALKTLTDGMQIFVKENKDEQQIDWASIPSGANPKAGHLPDKRMDRKSQQLENLALAVLREAKKGDLIVDFCSGSGHLGILIAHLLPDCTVILLENKEQSLLRARSRVHEMGLKNVYFFQCNLDFFIGQFDIGIALHACGVASDLVLDKCIKANAKFVICPCCYGSLRATDRLNYPRSNTFSVVPIEQYICIGHAADQTHRDHPLAARGARCMAVIDSDRGRLAEEFGYKVTLSRLKPLSCTPKNNLLIGVPS